MMNMVGEEGELQTHQPCSLCIIHGEQLSQLESIVVCIADLAGYPLLHMQHCVVEALPDNK